ncbi:phage tail sheath C-terminal domain-containing protein [uncultured Dokdonia sp.]|uniref:phage tail sheath family protein n=1 Tax=uncultured Dokdonia sp. TaxID=575653 RepID=UPI0026385D3B|nr:phage tail sheath C-terminal domain-containing protein [uncultured Dokdonia sp.]
MNYKTPGAFIEEVSIFPPSVAQVETAIPAFVGYTATGPANEPTRITSLLEYKTLFGGAQPQADISVKIENGVATASLDKADVSDFKMYYAMQMYFANGGGPCYIVSVGNYGGGVSFTELEAGLAEVAKEDEPTLLVFPDALSLPTEAEVYSLYITALNQCNKLQDRFAIMDTIEDNQASVDSFRNSNVPGDKYGAVYYPHLETILNYEYEDGAVTIDANSTNSAGVAITETDLAALKTANSGAYNAAKNDIASSLRVVLPPSSAMAGVYAKVDSTSGVWKAPANVGLNYVVAPTLKISSQDQESLNVDANGGKSINAIRTFTGKGTLVWGARTLDGNSNEWRYVSVRRFFNMVEESVKKASERFVFESNDSNTWVRVRAMIENFLNTQWRAGALAGATPEDAYFVRVGLGETMSAQDVLEGKMIVEIGMAAVRPAEFIILRFSHKLQES